MHCWLQSIAIPLGDTHCLVFKLDVKNSSVRIGDAFETAFAIMWYRHLIEPTIRLLELCEWELQMYNQSDDPAPCEALLKRARAWEPKGGGQRSEAPQVAQEVPPDQADWGGPK